MIVSKLDFTNHDMPQYVITQGMIDWSNDNWYQNTANALWLQLVTNGVKDWLNCRKAMKLCKDSASFQFYNTLSGLIKTIDSSLASEMKMVSEKIHNISQSRKNKTNITFAARMLFDLVDGVIVTSKFFDNQEWGTYATISLRESDQVQYQHIMFVRKISMPEHAHRQLLRHRYDCDASHVVCRNFLMRLRQKSSQS